MKVLHNAKHYKTYVQVGLNIMRCRKERGLTQEDLAEMAGYSRHQIQRVEAATSAPTLALLLDVAEAMNIPVEWLLEVRDR